MLQYRKFTEGALMVEFNIPPSADTAFTYMKDAVNQHKISGDGKYTKLCTNWITEHMKTPFAYLTPSCTASLEMAAVLCGIQKDDEVILPSYTFCSTADAFVQRGAKLVFVDIRPDTMNIDEKLIEDAITDRTRVIVPVHYAGVACDMDVISDIAKRHHLFVAEDAAQAFGAKYHEKYLGTLGDFGCYSFHETKNYSMGEGGAFCFNNKEYRDAAEIVREKGTDRSRFFRGQIDKYTWRDYGSSYLPSDLNAAFLWAQLEKYQEIFNDRMTSWNDYQNGLKPLAVRGMIEQPVIPDGCKHNAHMYYIKLADMETRQKLIGFLKSRDIQSVFHYIPLHSSPAGMKYGRFHGCDRYTTKESERLLRLPMYYGLTEEKRRQVIDAVNDFFK